MHGVIHQHNWTGALAVYALIPAQPLITHQIKGVSQQSSKSSSKGMWLKAASHARLRLYEDEYSSCGLELRLQEHLLLRCALLDEQLGLYVLPSSSTSNGSILVLQPKQQACTAAPVCYCFQFYDTSDCNSFTSAVRAAVCNRHTKQTQQRREQQQPHQQQEEQEDQIRQAQASRAATKTECVIHALKSTTTPAAALGQGSNHLLPYVTLSRSAAGAAVTDAATAAADTALQLAGRDAGSSAGAAPLATAYVKELIKKFLLDPSFQSVVDQVDAMWDEVEQEVMADGIQCEDNIAW